MYAAVIKFTRAARGTSFLSGRRLKPPLAGERSSAEAIKNALYTRPGPLSNAAKLSNANHREGKRYTLCAGSSMKSALGL